MRDSGPSIRTSAGPAIVAALALAIVSMAAAQPAPALVRSQESGSTCADVEPSRLVAAAVAAAKNLLGVDSAAHALLDAEAAVSLFLPAGSALPLVRDERIIAWAPALSAHLIDLPPPVC